MIMRAAGLKENTDLSMAMRHAHDESGRNLTLSIWIMTDEDRDARKIQAKTAGFATGQFPDGKPALYA